MTMIDFNSLASRRWPPFGAWFGALLFAVCSFVTPVASAFDAWDVKRPASQFELLPKAGQWQIISIWSLDCIPCEIQKPALSQFNTRYKSVNIVGVSIDGKDQLTAIRQRLADKPVSFDNGVVDYELFEKQYQQDFSTRFLATPTYIVYSPQGELKGIHTGPIDFTNLAKLISSRI